MSRSKRFGRHEVLDVRGTGRFAPPGLGDLFVGRIAFQNGYTGSVVRHGGSHGNEEGLFEAAVLWDGRLVYDTPVTSDVEGYLSEEEVARFLDGLAALPDPQAPVATRARTSVDGFERVRLKRDVDAWILADHVSGRRPQPEGVLALLVENYRDYSERVRLIQDEWEQS